ncbi:phosphodiester glycosidase family protein [Sphingobacteriaceae bacterium WQ 2009]|uniref:Phosphodiester glycosidase family protein n=1 Tax=Rhinopithecimicrobium faecis TaxID=2820698 RepID=A0A8T4HED7_9SPHI|nr:phosphodiester glycosidase family protein [Sphingobacteriaceae bacterium WQ 2009]
MKKNFLFSVIFLLFFAACSKKEEGTQLPYDYSNVVKPNVKEIIENASWQQKEVAAGITWKYFQFPAIFESKQYINIIEIDFSKGLKLDIPYVKTGFLKTSEVAIAQQAFVAFNGSYFNTTTGGSTVFFKKEGQVINNTVNGFNSYRENGAFVQSSSGAMAIVAKPTAGWSALTEPLALAGGPLLMAEGKVLKQLDVDFNTTRHPRTALGITAKNTLIAVTVDGRSSQSQGLTIAQLSDLMEALGCISAINFDGGGSTTAWVQGEGVVNFPSDNGKFDHEGERAVATVFTVK